MTHDPHKTAYNSDEAQTAMKADPKPLTEESRETSEGNVPITSFQDTAEETPMNENPEDTPRQDGDLYIWRHGRLERIEREENPMRRVRMTEEAYQTAMELGKTMRQALNGYKPDISLVVSALVVAATQDKETASTAVRKYVIKMFQET